MDILEQIGENTARSTAGVIYNLYFKKEVDVISAGSVWVKGKLDVLPATGAVIWTIELADGIYPSDGLKDIVVENVEMKLKKLEG